MPLIGVSSLGTTGLVGVVEYSIGCLQIATIDNQGWWHVRVATNSKLMSDAVIGDAPIFSP